VSVAELSTVGVNLGNGANNVTINDGEQSKVTVTGGKGGNNVTINTVDSDTLPSVNEIDGHQTYTVTLGTNANTLNITPGGSDPTFAPGAPGDDGGSDDSTPPSNNPNGEPDSVIASNQVIVVAMGVGGSANQVANIETGVNSQVTLTTGNGNDAITILADNDLWTHSTVNDTVTFAGEGGSQIKVNTGNGNDNIVVNVDNSRFDFVHGKWLDAGSNVQITTGNGNNNVIVTLGTATQGNTANVQTGSGNDRVQFDVADINAGIVANGGVGTDTIALVSASAGASAANLAGISNFEILEVTNVLHNNVDLDNYEPQNVLNHVILDNGFTGFGGGSNVISGAEQNFQLDLLAGSPGQNLNILVDNAAINTNDAVGIKLDAGNAGLTDFGQVTLNPGSTGFANVVEKVSIDSTSTNPSATQNNLQLSDAGIQTLNILHDAGGDVTLDLDGSLIGNGFAATALTNVQAGTFTGGIIWDDNGPGSLSHDDLNITFSAPVSGNDSLKFGNGNDTVTLGNGTNTVTFGTGSDAYTAGNGANNVTFNTSGGNHDTVVLGGGAGNDTVTFTGSGGTASTITFGAHTGVDTVAFNNVAESAFSTPDVITGFQAGADMLSFNHLMFLGGAGNISPFASVTSDAAALTVIHNDALAGHDSIVYNSSTGHVFIDTTAAGVPNMEIALVGQPAITAGNIHIA
jgi:hypothetical protein